jgi:membrane protein implicated in regulation of membrane protease activity
MFIKPKSRSTRGYTIYAIVGTILEETALLVALLWVLPFFNIHLTLWWIVAIMVFSLGSSYFTYIMGRRALSKRLTFGPEAIIGSKGIVATPLNPTGYVKVRGELWEASCQSRMEVDDEVVVTRMEGLKLLVMPKVDNSSQPPQK